MKCMECQHANLRQDPAMARLGFAGCQLGKPWVFQSLERDRDCHLFVASKQEVVDQRRQWFSKIRSRSST